MKSSIPFPQPDGIFTMGQTFDVLPFFQAVQDLYQRVVIEGTAREDLPIETEAFATLFMNRSSQNEAVRDNAVVFELFDGLRVVGADTIKGDLVFEMDGKSYLQVGCF